MKKIKYLTVDEIITLTNANKNHPSSRVRWRSQIILLSHKGYQLKEIADICQVVRQTVSTTINRWENSGLLGLYDAPRPGQPPVLTDEDKQFVYDMIESEPRSINIIMASLEDQRGKVVSKATVKRVVKKKRTWKRIRKSLKPVRNEEEFRQAYEEIKALERLRAEGAIDVYYFDESGFDLIPSVPYAWQPIGERIEIKAERSRRLNVLGFMDKDNNCISFIFESTINSEAVIACFDYLSKNIDKNTVAILDNASIHKSEKFLSHLPEWEERGLNLKFLPPYSPELNLIEILWQKIKYQWLSFSAYSSFTKLKESLNDILLNFGSQYRIEFA